MQKLDVYLGVKVDEMLHYINDFSMIENIKSGDGYLMVGVLPIGGLPVIMISEPTSRPYDIDQYKELTDFNGPLGGGF